MKNLRKAMATLAALSVMCVSASAFAAVTEVKTGGDAASFNYDAVESGNTVVATVDTAKAQTGKQMTFIILGNDADEANVTADDILYIDQKELKADSNTFTGVINTARIEGEPDSIPDGDYIIKLGYYDTSDEFQITKAVMTVASGSSGQTVTIKWGDVSSDGYVTSADALEVIYYTLGQPNTIAVKDVENNSIGSVAVGNTIAGLKWGDVSSDGYVTSADALEVIYYTLGQPNTIAVKDVENNSIGSVAVGNTIDVTYTAE